MLGHVTLAEGSAALVAVLGGIAAVLTALWKLSQTIGTYSREHRALMTDLKERTEGLEKATPGVTPVQESKAVEDARNGA